MSASRVNPNLWDGEERSSGHIAKNDKPSSATSPDFKGRIYLAGVGWYWLSGWKKESKYGEFMVLRAQEMTDAQAGKFCKPKSNHRAPSPSPNQSQNGSSPSDDIPF